MKLAMLGSTGLAGTATVHLAMQRGHEVRALVRKSTSPPNALAAAEIVWGDALDPDAVAKTIAGVDAVISTLGGYRGPESIEGGTSNILTAMRETGTDRLVLLQGFHINFPEDPHNPGRRLVQAFLSTRCRPLLRHGAALGELLLRTGDLSWTLVRIPRIVQGGPSGRARLGTFALGPWSCVRLGDVASYLIQLIEDGTAIRQAPMLYTTTRHQSERDPIATTARAHP